MARARDIARSALTWAGFAGVVLVGVPPMVLGYPLVLVDPNRAISDWYFRRIARVLMGEPELTEGLGERDTLDLAERVHARMRAALAEMEPS
ncbi:MAG: hypothetical protein HYZ29_12775 [Myxococcales bacterium]|nr:hypothetical protein [Myxococcales bacterium]